MALHPVLGFAKLNFDGQEWSADYLKLRGRLIKRPHPVFAGKCKSTKSSLFFGSPLEEVDIEA